MFIKWSKSLLLPLGVRHYSNFSDEKHRKVMIGFYKVAVWLVSPCV